jgi:hypothetical protein
VVDGLQGSARRPDRAHDLVDRPLVGGLVHELALKCLVLLAHFHVNSNLIFFLLDFPEQRFNLALGVFRVRQLLQEIALHLTNTALLLLRRVLWLLQSQIRVTQILNFVFVDEVI